MPMRTEANDTTAVRVPSPHIRLALGTGLMLLLFLGFGVYTVRQMQQLRRFQSDVLERNRKDTLLLLRMQQDAYSLAISVRDMITVVPSPPLPNGQRRHPQAPIPFWGAEFQRIRVDLNQALEQEAEVAPAGHSDDQRQQLSAALQQFWSVSDQVFTLAGRGYDSQAVDLVQRELDPQRMVIHNIIARWLVQNDQSERQTEAAMRGIYSQVTHDFLLLTLILVGLGAAVAVWSLRANRASFEQVHQLASQLDRHSRQLEEVSWRYLKVQEDTLQRVSRDLHDEFGQILTALGAVLARAERQASRAEDQGPKAATTGELVQEIHQARGVVQEAQQKIRTLSQMLRPTILDDFGLERTLRWYVGEFTRSMGVAARFEQTGEIPYIPPETAIHLYRIAQEAMTNTARHARADHVTVRLGCRQDWLRLEIIDDGCGFATEPSGNGVGMVSMRERAERLGGTFSMTQENGCIIRVEVPKPAAVRPAMTGAAPDERDSTPVHHA